MEERFKLAFVEDKTDVAHCMAGSFYKRLENIVGKGENAGHKCFQKLSFLGIVR